MNESDSIGNVIKNPVRQLREVRYSLREMQQELNTDRQLLQIGKELIGQDEISRVFNLEKGKNAAGKSE